MNGQEQKNAKWLEAFGVIFRGVCAAELRQPTGTLRHRTATDIINAFVDIPYLTEPAEAVLIDWTIELLVWLFNEVFGHAWRKSWMFKWLFRKQLRKEPK